MISKDQFHWLSGETPQSLLSDIFGDFKGKYIRIIAAIFKNIIGCESVANGRCMLFKNRSSKTSWDHPFLNVSFMLNHSGGSLALSVHYLEFCNCLLWPARSMPFDFSSSRGASYHLGGYILDFNQILRILKFCWLYNVLYVGLVGRPQNYDVYRTVCGSALFSNFI
jgi:hypothetical protein